MADKKTNTNPSNTPFQAPEFPKTFIDPPSWMTGENNNKPRYEGMLSKYIDKFYAMARGHLVNKYHVGFWGEYVWEALRLMDRNSFADKYHLEQTKTFYDTKDPYLKAAFNQWIDLFYDRDTRVLNMYWAAKSATVGVSTAKMSDFNIDTTKGMKYPLIQGDQGPKELKLNIVDDQYMMWYQFFNALYNVQYSPLVLKTRSTWQKINVGIDLYMEGTTMERSSKNVFASNRRPFITDLALGQMFEFNSCVLTSAPDMKMGFTEAEPYSFNITFKYPNAFQGSFKNQLRFLRDNTCDGTDAAAFDKKTQTLRKKFFEDDYGWLKKHNKIYEAFDPDEYYSEYSKRHFSTKDA